MFQQCISHTWLQSKKDIALALFDLISLSWEYGVISQGNTYQDENARGVILTHLAHGRGPVVISVIVSCVFTFRASEH